MILAAVVVLYVTRIRGNSLYEIFGLKDPNTPELGGFNEAFVMDDYAHTPAADPIGVRNFPGYVQNLSRDGKYLFSEEFKYIQTGASASRCTAEHSHHPINRDKNRYVRFIYVPSLETLH